MADKKHQSLLQQFTTWSKNPQFSVALPLAGMTAGEIAYLLRRRHLLPEEQAKANVQDILLGGLTGTGLELGRWGLARFADDARKNNSIPSGVTAFAVNERKKS